MVMMIIAIVLLGIALATAWWHAEINGEYEIGGQKSSVKFSGDFKRTEVEGKVEAKSPLGTFDDETSDEYSDMNLDNIESLFGNVGLLTIVAMILAIVSLVFIIICGMRFLSVNIAVILCLITFLIALIGPIYLAVGLGDTLKKDDFPGEDGKVTENTVYGLMYSSGIETSEYNKESEYSSGIIEIGQGNSDELEVGPFNFISNEEKTRTASDGSKVKLSILSYPAIGWFMALIGMVFCLIAFAQVRRMKRVLGPPMYGGQRGPPPGYDRGPPRDYHGPPRDDRPPRRDDRPPRDEYDDYDRGPRRRQPRDDYYDGYDDYDRPPPRRR
jgi:hypothetical protein